MEDILYMKKMEKEKNIQVMIIIYVLKENIKVEKEMEKEKNIILKEFYHLKENI